MAPAIDAGRIVLQDVWYRYPVSRDWVLRGINFELTRGEFVGVVGSTGAGKSTLCLTLNGLIPHYHRGQLRGTITVGGQDTREMSVADLSTSIGLVFQDGDAQLVMSTVEEECMLGPLSQGRGRQAARDAARQAMATLEVAHLADRLPQTLSGGQKQRVAIAASLATGPEVLILDEATSELDSLTVHKLFALCDKLNRERRTTIVVVSHEMELLARYARRLLVVSNGQIVSDGSPGAVFAEGDLLEQLGLRRPQVAEVALRLRRQLTWPELPLTETDAVTRLERALASRRTTP